MIPGSVFDSLLSRAKAFTVTTADSQITFWSYGMQEAALTDGKASFRGSLATVQAALNTVLFCGHDTADEAFRTGTSRSVHIGPSDHLIDAHIIRTGDLPGIVAPDGARTALVDIVVDRKRAVLAVFCLCPDGRILQGPEYPRYNLPEEIHALMVRQGVEWTQTSFADPTVTALYEARFAESEPAPAFGM